MVRRREAFDSKEDEFLEEFPEEEEWRKIDEEPVEGADDDDNFYDIEKHAYPIIPEEVVKKYTDPERVAEVVRYIEQTTFENGADLLAIKSTLTDLKKQLNKVEVALDTLIESDKKYKKKLGIIDDQDPEPPARLVTRSEWEALPLPRYHGIKPFSHPINKVNFTFSTKTDSCETTEQCLKVMRKIQKQDIKNGMPDIAYNFLIGEDGNIYEGRGWYNTPALATKSPTPDYKTIDIAFIGDYNSDAYPYELFTLAIDILDEGIRNNFVSKDYKML